MDISAVRNLPSGNTYLESGTLRKSSTRENRCVALYSQSSSCRRFHPLCDLWSENSGIIISPQTYS